MFIKGENGGCITFENDNAAPAGSWYYVKARVKGDGAWPTLNFRTAKRKWLSPKKLLPVEGCDPEEWNTLRGCVQVPQGASGFTLTLGVMGLGPNEIVRYDNIEIYLLPAELVTGMKLAKGE